MTDRNNDRQSRDSLDQLTVAQAAQKLGISESGIRKRVRRGEIPHERDEKGRLWLYLAVDDTTRHNSRDLGRMSQDSPDAALLDELRAHNATLSEQLAAERRANEENRKIIAALSQRIPVIEAPQKPRRGPLADAENDEWAAERERARELQRQLTEVREQLEEEHSKGFWRRLFGGRRSIG